MTANSAIEAVWRIEQPKLTARLARYLRDIGLAEEVAGDAFLLALERWPRDGIPRNPAAWLTEVARNRALDRLRRTTMAQRPLAVGALFEQAALDQAVQPARENVGRDLQALLKLVEARQPLERVPEQQDAPPFAHIVETTRYGARASFEACFCNHGRKSLSK